MVRGRLRKAILSALSPGAPLRKRDLVDWLMGQGDANQESSVYRSISALDKAGFIEQYERKGLRLYAEQMVIITDKGKESIAES